MVSSTVGGRGRVGVVLLCVSMGHNGLRTDQTDSGGGRGKRSVIRPPAKDYNPSAHSYLASSQPVDMESCVEFGDTVLTSVVEARKG